VSARTFLTSSFRTGRNHLHTRTSTIILLLHKACKYCTVFAHRPSSEFSDHSIKRRSRNRKIYYLAKEVVVIKKLVDWFRDQIQRLCFVYFKRSDERRRNLLLRLIDDITDEIVVIEDQKEAREDIVRYGLQTESQLRETNRCIADCDEKIGGLRRQLDKHKKEVAQLDKSLKRLGKVVK